MEPLSVKEVLDSPAVKAIEIDILDAIKEDRESEYETQGNLSTVQYLLTIRKRIMNQMFVMTDEHKQLLAEFNEKLIDALLEMRQRSIKMYDKVLKADLPIAEVTGRVFLEEKYPKIHPVQSVRAEQIWDVLTDCDYHSPMYQYGAEFFYIFGYNNEITSENRLLYLSEDVENWNKGLDREITADMHLCHGFHNLTNNNEFSLFDLLWVRDFFIEVKCELMQCTGALDNDDLVCGVADYND